MVWALFIDFVMWYADCRLLPAAPQPAWARPVDHVARNTYRLLLPAQGTQLPGGAAMDFPLPASSRKNTGGAAQ